MKYLENLTIKNIFVQDFINRMNIDKSLTIE